MGEGRRCGAEGFWNFQAKHGVFRQTCDPALATMLGQTEAGSCRTAFMANGASPFSDHHGVKSSCLFHQDQVRKPQQFKVLPLAFERLKYSLKLPVAAGPRV